jgi:thiol-disulfide isomerase/thioredoxin
MMMKRGIVFVVLIVILVVIRLKVTEGFQWAGPSVVICKADWCGHCKKAAPEFQKLADASPITLSNGTQATVKILDADQDKEEIKKYNVRGYPSILIINGSETTEYPGDRTHDGVVDFLNQM